MSRQIFVDGQLFQTGALERGMGTLTIELLKATKLSSPEAKITIFLNRNLQMSEEHRTRMDRMLADFTCDWLELDTPEHGIESRARHNLEQYIDAHKSTSDVTYLLPALFLFDYFPLFPKNCQTALIFHDLIPLVMWQYLKNVFPGPVYFARFKYIYEADVILANSQATKDELVKLLGAEASRIAVIGGAPERFDLPADQAKECIAALGIKKPYILLPTGGGYMEHKNNTRAAEALLLLQCESEQPLTVVATSHYEAHEKAMLRLYLGDSIIFTDVVSIDQMKALYMNAQLVLVPSLAEGLGLPLLNAVALDIPVACSQIPVFTQLSDKEAFYAFDPRDPWDMRDKIFAGLARVDFEQKLQYYDHIRNEYSWIHAAERMLCALQAPATPHPSQPNRTLQILAPDPLCEFTDGYLAQALYAYAKNQWQLEYYIDPGKDQISYDDRGADFVRTLASCHELSDYPLANSDATPKLIFYSHDARFTSLALLNRIVKNAVIYVSKQAAPNLFSGLHEVGLLTKEVADTAHTVQNLLKAQGLLNVPEPFLNAKGIVAEASVYPAVVKTLKTLGLDCPIIEVADNTRETLNDYVNHDDASIHQLLSFIEEVYRD